MRATRSRDALEVFIVETSGLGEDVEFDCCAVNHGNRIDSSGIRLEMEI